MLKQPTVTKVDRTRKDRVAARFANRDQNLRIIVVDQKCVGSSPKQGRERDNKRHVWRCRYHQNTVTRLKTFESFYQHRGSERQHVDQSKKDNVFVQSRSRNSVD